MKRFMLCACEESTVHTNAGTAYIYDGLGSVLAEVMTNPSDYKEIQVTASQAYDVYGAVRSSSGTSTTDHKFVGSLGHTDEDSTGLIYMRARLRNYKGVPRS